MRPLGFMCPKAQKKIILFYLFILNSWLILDGGDGALFTSKWLRDGAAHSVPDKQIYCTVATGIMYSGQ